jgi:hypothetical protein
MPFRAIFAKMNNYSRSKKAITIYFNLTQVFSANYDQDTIVEQRFPRVILTRFIRVNPTSWEGGAAIRMEFLGSYVGRFLPQK